MIYTKSEWREVPAGKEREAAMTGFLEVDPPLAEEVAPVEIIPEPEPEPIPLPEPEPEPEPVAEKKPKKEKPKGGKL